MERTGRSGSDVATLVTLAPMIDWWSETDHAIVECLRAAGPMSPEELARRIGLSVGEVTAFLTMLARENRVRIQIVELTPEEECRPSRRQTPATIP
jgi:predicted transcriptional regulator